MSGEANGGHRIPVEQVRNREPLSIFWFTAGAVLVAAPLAAAWRLVIELAKWGWGWWPA